MPFGRYTGFDEWNAAVTRVLTDGVRWGASALAALALAGGLAVAVPPAVSAAPAAVAAAAQVELTGLTTNGRVDPLGIPGATPSFGWQARSTARGVVQSAYQVQVLAEGDPVWDSGKVVSADQVDVAYGGPALTAQTRYTWQVRTWDGDDTASAWSAPASFETGLLSTADWGGADWIGGAAAELNRWTDYTATFEFRIDNLVFAPFVRMSDLRNGYMWQLSVADGTPRFRPHRRINGTFGLMDNKDISATITAAQLRTGWHTMEVTFDGNQIVTKLDGSTIDTRTATASARGYVGFRSTVATEGTESQTVRDVRVVAKNGDVLLDTDFAADLAAGVNPFTAGTITAEGLRQSGNAESLWRSPDNNLPMLRTEFSTATGKTVERARVYATSRGIYELNLNGEKVGDQFLAPGWTDYRKRFLHQTYDVTDLVRSGANAFGAELADGWWAGRLAHRDRGNYGTQLSLLARLRVDYTDGTSAWIDTDDSWTSRSGPYTFTDNIDGETYDARLERAGWDQPGFAGAGWAPVAVRTAPAGIVEPQLDDPVRVTEELPALKRTEPASGRFVYDVGQNMVGVARMRLQGQAGKTVTIRYGEELNRDGTLYVDNLRSAKVTDRYTFAADGTVTYEPKFTQHGFRYIEISGAATAPAATDVTGVVWGSDLPGTGDLETSDPMLDQLLSNISWGQRGNFLSVPTDTPARDERMGWTGDINVFAPTASYLRDTRAFLTKWLVDLRDTASANGNLPGVAPELPPQPLGGGVGWSDAMITVPYAVWHAHDDAAVVRENYAAMQKFFTFVENSAGADLIDADRGSYNDWLHLEDPTPASVLGTAYFAENARMMAEMAAAIGEDEDAAEYAELSTAIRAAFTDTLVAADGTVQGNSQAGYAMALGMDLVDDPALRELVGERYVAKLARTDFHLSTGFLGTPWLLPALSSIGRDDLAYRMLLQKDYPSWGYEVEMGATTMWERWNSIMPDGSFGDVSMNSFNHYAYGAVGDWMYQNIGGISAVEPGYRVSRIAPVVGGGLTHGAGSKDSVYGPVTTDWTQDGADFSLQVQVPVNTTAQVVLPAATAHAVTEGDDLIGDVEGVTDVTDDGDTVTVTVGSGSYDFAVTASAVPLGTVLEDLATLTADADDLLDGGQLTTADHDRLVTGADGVAEDVTTALQAAIAADDAALVEALTAALQGVRGTRTWLAGSAVAAPVRADLDGRLASVEARLVTAVTTARGVTLALPPVAGAVLPGGTVTGTVEVVNRSGAAVTGVQGTVTVPGLGEVVVSAASVADGATVQLPVTLPVPEQADAGGFDAELSLTVVVGGTSYTVSERTDDWATVTSGLDVGEASLVVDGSDRSEHATITVPVANTGTAAVRAHVALGVPAGWRSVTSADVRIPAGESVDVLVPVVLPLDLIAGAQPLTVVVRRGAATLTSAETTVSVDLPRPPTAAFVDHVDFGNTASENAHGILASQNSGTSNEAGLSRRYSHAGFPGSWFSAQLTVPAGKPFVLRNVETFDGAKTKKYHVYVNDVRVKTQLVPREQSGAGFKVYDTLIDHPSLTSNNGTVRVKFEYPSDGAGFHDPSIADTWVLALPADTQAPDVSPTVASGTVGSAGWYRSDVTVGVQAADNRTATPVVEVRDGAAWAPYAGPVVVTGDGEHEVAVRARDEAGNVSPARSVTVGIDTTAPVTTLTATPGAGIEGADSASLAFAATDATSGVATTSYRLDGGPWTEVGSSPVPVTGFGDHVVEFASTDQAGNAEPLRVETVTLADVETVAALVAPQVSGTPRIGSTLTATSGSWNTKGLALAHQWLRDGVPVPGATGTSYQVGTADVGARLAMRVTATKAGKQPGVATSAATAVVAKVGSRTTVKVAKAKVRPGQAVKVTVRVVASPAATGRVAIRVDGKVVKRVALKKGRAVVPIKIRKPGKHQVTAAYAGSAVHAPSTSPARPVTVLRR